MVEATPGNEFLEVLEGRVPLMATIFTQTDDGEEILEGVSGPEGLITTGWWELPEVTEHKDITVAKQRKRTLTPQRR